MRALFVMLLLSLTGCIPVSNQPSKLQRQHAIAEARFHQDNIRRSIREISDSVDEAATQGTASRRRFSRLARDTELMLVEYLRGCRALEPEFRDLDLERECEFLLNKIRSVDWEE